MFCLIFPEVGIVPFLIREALTTLSVPSFGTNDLTKASAQAELPGLACLFVVLDRVDFDETLTKLADIRVKNPQLPIVLIHDDEISKISSDLADIVLPLPISYTDIEIALAIVKQMTKPDLWPSQKEGTTLGQDRPTLAPLSRHD